MTKFGICQRDERCVCDKSIELELMYVIGVIMIYLDTIRDGDWKFTNVGQ